MLCIKDHAMKLYLLRNIVFWFFPSSALEEAFGNENAVAPENQPRYYKFTEKMSKMIAMKNISWFLAEFPNSKSSLIIFF